MSFDKNTEHVERTRAKADPNGIARFATAEQSTAAPVEAKIVEQVDIRRTDASISLSAGRSTSPAPAQGPSFPPQRHCHPWDEAASKAAVLQDFRSIWPNLGRPRRAMTVCRCLIAGRHRRQSRSHADLTRGSTNELFRAARYLRYQHVLAGGRSARRRLDGGTLPVAGDGPGEQRTARDAERDSAVSTGCSSPSMRP